MFRELTSHQVNGCNSDLQIVVCDEPGSGGACHHYQIINVSKQNTPEGDLVEADIKFQNGPVKEVGTNGLTHEALLAILIDRLECFQSGKYACEENAAALSNLNAAQLVLKRRTEKRLARGVEGTHAV